MCQVKIYSHTVFFRGGDLCEKNSKASSVTEKIMALFIGVNDFVIINVFMSASLHFSAC